MATTDNEIIDKARFFGSNVEGTFLLKNEEYILSVFNYFKNLKTFSLEFENKKDNFIKIIFTYPTHKKQINKIKLK